VDIACIQVPAIRYGKLGSMSTASTSIFHSKDSIAAIIILNRDLHESDKRTNSQLVTVKIQLNSKSFYIINQYYQFSDPEDHMSLLSNMYLQAQQHNIVYCVGLNAKLSLCSPLSWIKRKKLVEETLWDLGFQMANEPRQPSTYYRYTDYQTNIDIIALRECSGTKS